MNLVQILAQIPTRFESIWEPGRSAFARARTRVGAARLPKGRSTSFSGCYFLIRYRPSYPSGHLESNNLTLQTSRYQPASLNPSL